MGNSVVHFEIGCRNKEKTAAFYEAVFGWTSSAYGPMGRQITTGSQDGIQGHITALGHEPRHYVIVYIEVDNISGAIDKAKRLGGTPVAGPLPGPDGRQFAWIKDPEGTMFGLITAEPG